MDTSRLRYFALLLTATALGLTTMVVPSSANCGPAQCASVHIYEPLTGTADSSWWESHSTQERQAIVAYQLKVRGDDSIPPTYTEYSRTFAEKLWQADQQLAADDYGAERYLTYNFNSG